MFVRALGTSLRAPWGIDIDQALFRDERSSQPNPVAYEEFDEGPLSVVRSRIGRETQTWWLDPARDYMPVRIVYCADGEPPAETRIELDQFDGVWFPRTITSYANGQVTQSVHVIGAEFNRAEHPAHLTPADIGIEPGMVIMDLLAEQGDPVWVWGGERAITLEQFGELERSGQIERGPANQAFLDAALADMRARGITPGWTTKTRDADAPPVADAATDIPRTARDMMSEWERYTREFIETHKLDKKQTERAWSTLQNCQRQAARYIAARRNDLEETERKLDAASADAAQASSRRTETLRQRLAQLVGPIDEIFENRLKPGLDRLLNKEQRDQTPNRRGDADRGGD